MMYVGVDGCRSGWVAVWRGESGWDWAVYTSYAELWNAHQAASAIWTDMPIGLPVNQARGTDIEARRVLGRRGSSVFNVPMRGAVYAADYRAACDANFALTGKMISMQSWHITGKMRELDILLRADSDARQNVGESHPEVVFWALSGSPMTHNKKTRAGRAERLAVLAPFCPDADALLSEGRARMGILKKHMADDDWIDALALAVAAELPDPQQMPDPPEYDAYGLPMRILYPRR